MSFDRSFAFFGAARLTAEQAQHAVAVAYGRDLGISDDDRLVGEIHREMRAALDPGRAVAKDIIELVAKLVDHLFDALAGKRVLVARLRGRQDREVLEPPVGYQRLFQ